MLVRITRTWSQLDPNVIRCRVDDGWIFCIGAFGFISGFWHFHPITHAKGDSNVCSIICLICRLGFGICLLIFKTSLQDFVDLILGFAAVDSLEPFVERMRDLDASL